MGNNYNFGIIIEAIDLTNVSIRKTLKFRPLYKDTELEEVPDVQELSHQSLYGLRFFSCFCKCELIVVHSNKETQECNELWLILNFVHDGIYILLLVIILNFSPP
ncbi:hypothetical protein EUGRSUZ_J03107 [Eucalyptus grandis]|uniref:Uncharacterized protein n=2 Tax=Eucalyptus grandis TaxID=71139 RepID=A0A059AKG4_EUCGR|nr:hypothetical protein EUGRSUZ_J03107 [Eucalyptus grandis]